VGLSGVAHGEDCSGLPARAIRRDSGVVYPWSARRAEVNRVALEGMPGVGLTSGARGQAWSEMLALKPYRGKPAVRNFREGGGNVGIIRSPVRATALPDKPVREPDAGKPHVRFDEEGRETHDGPLGERTPDPKGRKQWGAAGPAHDRARPSLYRKSKTIPAFLKYGQAKGCKFLRLCLFLDSSAWHTACSDSPP
jgi:hypothetical protein